VCVVCVSVCTAAVALVFARKTVGPAFNTSPGGHRGLVSSIEV
jgi:hypothetical protein